MGLKILFGAIFILILLTSGIKAQVTFVSSTEIISVSNKTDISDLRMLNSNVFRIEGNVCHLEKPIRVEASGIFSISSETCDILQMYPGTFMIIRGEIYFNNILVTSFDPYTQKPIPISKETYANSRPFISTEYPAKYFYAENSEFSHLGYYHGIENGSKWGLALYDTPKAKIINSRLHHNYFGLYTFNASHLVVADSEVYDNLEYGLDFHDYSDNHWIINNEIYRNGNHGIIYSKYCDNNTIIGNLVRDNNTTVFVKGEDRNYGTHGIMLHKDSTYNKIINNTVINNVVGIYLEESDYNLVEGNNVINDNSHGIYISRSNNNSLLHNLVANSNGYSIYSYYSYDNSYANNNLSDLAYVKTEYKGQNYSLEGNTPSISPSDKGSEDLVNIRKESQVSGDKNESLSIFGITDKLLLTKIFLIVGLIAVAIVIIFFESIVLLVRGRRDGSDD
ncbi:MAG: right-handed parallel beta-helix repeat-containing protein [Nanoarchaeota archaeon]|nr:right-handed parallel beta-helix repeat-containing protein [Nanoarchaeota archaeon]